MYGNAPEMQLLLICFLSIQLLLLAAPISDCTVINLFDDYEQICVRHYLV